MKNMKLILATFALALCNLAFAQSGTKFDVVSKVRMDMKISSATTIEEDTSYVTAYVLQYRNAAYNAIVDNRSIVFNKSLSDLGELLSLIDKAIENEGVVYTGIYTVKKSGASINVFVDGTSNWFWLTKAQVEKIRAFYEANKK